MRSLALRQQNDLPLTPADIAAAVEPSAAERRAAKRLAELRRRRDEIRAETIGLHAAKTGVGRTAVEQQIVLLARERDAVEQEITVTRGEWAAARTSRADAVAGALASTRQREAQRALTAIHDLRAAWGVLRECVRQQRRAGCDIPELISARDLLAPLERAAARVLGDK